VAARQQPASFCQNDIVGHLIKAALNCASPRHPSGMMIAAPVLRSGQIAPNKYAHS
jgi:hypothetical protein